MEFDDDVFFADLSKRIALLIAEDDDEENTRLELPFPVSKPENCRKGYAVFPQVMIPPAHVYEFGPRKESRGTGVFIPKSSLPKKGSCKSNCKAGSYRTISTASQFCSISSCNQSHHKGNKKLNG
ncbi:hypothetical protein HPP92_000387 [Vanilla planifolia]|uniref:Uncharacterized protein n=1 Tax=Vanilla planifolia TaxID=51239 RepID=A0A835RP28_VANPL|nr:hypothetical protein HPP92_000387 [Vanilla planifolia]